MATSNRPDGIGEKEGYLDRNAKLVPSDPSTMALTSAAWVAGHHRVENKDDLLSIKAFTLSPSTYGTYISGGEDALGQLWYVRSENAFYQLIDWNNRSKAEGWSKTNIKASKGTDGSSTSETTSTAAGWLTGITINGDGTLTNSNAKFEVYKSDDVNKSYASAESQFTIPVISNIGVTETSNGRTLSYVQSTYTLLSQSHHGGSIEGDFLTKASLSNTGTLSGTAGSFTNTTTNANHEYANTNNGTYLNADGSKNTAVVSYVYINSSGKLSVSYAKVPPIMSGLSFNSDGDTITTTFTYPNADGELSEITYTSSTNGGNTLALPIVDDNHSGLLLSSTYKDIINQISNAKTASQMTFTSDNTKAWGKYNLDGAEKTTDFPNASTSTYGAIAIGYGALNAFPGDVGKANTDWIEDIENRLNKKDTILTRGTTTGSATFTVYKADGNTVIGTYNNLTSYSIEAGCFFECTYTIGWKDNGSANYGYIYSTSGVATTNAKSDNSKVISDVSGSWGSYTCAKTQLLRGQSKTFGTQTTNWYTGQTAKSLKLASDNTIQRDNGSAKTDKHSISFSVSTFNTYCRWYGITSINPLTSSVDEIKNAISKLTKTDKTWTKGITIDGSIAKTNESNPYFIYVYPKDCGKLSSASVPGADATKWFNTTSPGEVNIASETNGYVVTCYYVYSLNANALNGAKLTFA